MAILMITEWCPFDKQEEAQKILLNFPKLPPYIKKWQFLAAADGNSGVKMYNIVYIEEGNFDKAHVFIHKALSLFAKIQGYTYTIEPVISSGDMQKILSLKL
ncbi:MAG: hypothetical protein ACFFCS_14360 [Candidatus Hodarchaeota archaeon]